MFFVQFLNRYLEKNGHYLQLKNAPIEFWKKFGSFERFFMNIKYSGKNLLNYQIKF